MVIKRSASRWHNHHANTQTNHRHIKRVSLDVAWWQCKPIEPKKISIYFDSVGLRCHHATSKEIYCKCWFAWVFAWWACHLLANNSRKPRKPYATYWHTFRASHINSAMPRHGASTTQSHNTTGRRLLHLLPQQGVGGLRVFSGCVRIL